MQNNTKWAEIQEKRTGKRGKYLHIARRTYCILRTDLWKEATATMTALVYFYT
jgi:hypothetical protein